MKKNADQLALAIPAGASPPHACLWVPAVPAVAARKVGRKNGRIRKRKG